MHRSDALQGQVVVLHREHALLHLTTVPSVDDALFAAGRVEGNAGLRVQTQLLVVLYLSLRSVVDDEVRLKVLQFLSSGLNEHVLHEVSLPSHLNDEANSQTGSLVGSAESVNHVQLLIAKLLDGNFLYLGPNLLAHGVVVVLIFLSSPPNLVLALCVLDNVLVLRRTTSVDTGHYVHCIQLGVYALVVTSQACLCLLFEEILIRRIVCYHGRTCDAILCQI